MGSFLGDQVRSRLLEAATDISNPHLLLLVQSRKAQTAEASAAEGGKALQVLAGVRVLFASLLRLVRGVGT